MSNIIITRDSQGQTGKGSFARDREQDVAVLLSSVSAVVADRDKDLVSDISARANSCCTISRLPDCF